MNADRWKRIEEVFNEACDLPVEDQSRFLSSACRGDDALRREIELLLESTDSSVDYFDRLAKRAGIPTMEESDSGDMAGRRIGSYRLIRLLGRGGMGAVYLAHRDDAQFELQAALKLLPLGFDSEEARQRFLKERQILARLDHPGVARLLDGGVTDDGTPFYVMEHVDGMPIDEYCDTHHLTIDARLEVFLRVCDAVEHAHRHLVVHRDLKPSNILVTADAEVKLLDFGIARLVDRERSSTGATFSERAHPMTLAYASPEQVRGDAITTASDVYSLGILLYKLLSGYHPYGTAFSSPLEAERAICREEPTRPSVRFQQFKSAQMDEEEAQDTSPETIARARGTTPLRLVRDVSGDLDTIVMMALRKEPHRRYESVHQLAEDLVRYRDGFPVTARTDTLGYRASRFLRRNRIAVIGAGVLVLLLAAVVWLGIRYTLTTSSQSRAIAREAETTEQVSALLVDLFKAADPSERSGDTVMVRTILERGLEQVDSLLIVQPDVGTRMVDVLGEVYSNLGMYDEEVALRENAIALTRRIHGEESRELAGQLDHLAVAAQRRRDFIAAESLYTAVLEMRRRFGGDPAALAATIRRLGVTLRENGHLDSAEIMTREALAVATAHLGEDHFQSVQARLDLAYALRGKGDLDSAEALYSAAIPQLRQHGDSGTRMLGPALNNLGFLFRTRGEYGQAEDLYREAVELEREYGTAPNVILLLGNLANALVLQERFEEAKEVLREVVSVAEHQWPLGHWRVGAAHGALGDLHLNTGDTVAAEREHRTRVESYSSTLGPDHAWTRYAEAVLATSLTGMGRHDEAEQLLLEGYATLRATSGDEDQYTQDALGRLIRLYEVWGKPELARQFRAELVP